MSGKSSETKGMSRASNPFLQAYQKVYLGGTKLNLGEIDLNKISLLFRAMCETHDTFGRQLQDMALGKNR